MTIDELQARQSEIKARLQEIDGEYPGEELAPEARDEWNRLNEEHEGNVTRLSELVARRDRVEELSGNSENREPAAGSIQVRKSGGARGEDIWDLSTVRSSVSGPQEATRELQDRAKRAIEGFTFPNPNANREDAQAHLERLVSNLDGEKGVVSQQLLVTGSPDYRRAFGKFLANQPLSANEEAAQQRALSLTGNKGGFAVPTTLDPTLIPTSNSSVNPYRQIAQIESIVTDTWQGVTSGAITAERAEEAAESEDNSPTLAQPEATPTKVHAFVPYSIEVGGDWGGLEASMAKLIQEAKDDEEATAFSTGSGEEANPEGIITGAEETVESAGEAAIAVGDLTSVEEALPPRFRPRAVWLGNRTQYNRVRALNTGEAGEWTLWVPIAQGFENQVPTPGNTGHTLLGYPSYECSALESKAEGEDLVLTLGDFRYFVIVERLGMTVETIPHLFGENQRPTGQRGLYAYWRNTSKVLNKAAFRVLKLK